MASIAQAKEAAIRSDPGCRTSVEIMFELPVEKQTARTNVFHTLKCRADLSCTTGARWTPDTYFSDVHTFSVLRARIPTCLNM